MAAIPTRALPSGDDLPIVGFGTWDLTPDEVREVLPTALDLGYTHIDTAEGYQNEGAIGDVLTEYDRSDLFLTSKVLPSNLHYEDVLRSLESSLERLGVDTLDLYLIHWPNPTISLRETLEALERAYEEDLVRNVGVSNFGIYELQFAQKISDIPLAANQIEYHPWYARRELVNYCHEHDIVVEAAAPLARASYLDDPVLAQIAEATGVTPAQIALKWAVEQDVVVLPKSTDPAHIEANLNLFAWTLDADQRADLDGLDRGENVYQLDIDDPVYGIPA